MITLLIILLVILALGGGIFVHPGLLGLLLVAAVVLALVSRHDRVL